MGASKNLYFQNSAIEKSKSYETGIAEKVGFSRCPDGAGNV
jgi:hypothetical protein